MSIPHRSFRLTCLASLARRLGSLRFRPVTFRRSSFAVGRVEPGEAGQFYTPSAGTGRGRSSAAGRGCLVEHVRQGSDEFDDIHCTQCTQ